MWIEIGSVKVIKFYSKTFCYNIRKKIFLNKIFYICKYLRDLLVYLLKIFLKLYL